ncbi:MAG TPA: 16S rRNA (guanine(966)-N(2))-methyltransferase RsmD [Phycisphaerae bacterium]|nr:16S rRNA (guanine(966)-N(2))-methyltransferase RsmD [Phycisphaerae bacterium]
MRIIAGTHRGRKLVAPEGKTTRPMTDRVRENLFNILGPQTMAEAVVLDLFCGSGALGLEALSRGAASCTFVETDRDAVRAVETNCERLGLALRTRLLRKDALRPGPWGRPTGAAAYTLLFVDPPYRLTDTADGQARLADMVARLTQMGGVAVGAVVMLRARRDVTVALPWPGFDLDDTRSYGTTTLHLMTRRDTACGKEPE